MKLAPLFYKRSIVVLFFTLGLTLFPIASSALDVRDVPNSRQVNGGWVTDMADILSDTTESRLNQSISKLEARNGAEIAVVTVPETAPAASPKAFATQLFETWKIGKKGRDNGVLFLTSVGDRRVEIETGYGVEGTLTDAKVSEILKTSVIPRFKQQDFEGGIVAGTEAMIGVLQAPVKIEPSQLSIENRFELYSWTSLTGFLCLSLLGAFANFWLAHHLSQKPIAISPTGYTRVSPKGKNIPSQDSKIYWVVWLGTVCAIMAVVVLLAIFLFRTQRNWGSFPLTFGPIVIVILYFNFYITGLISHRFDRIKNNTMRLRKFRCQECGSPLKKLENRNLELLLSPPQQTAKELASVEYEARYCDCCFPKIALDSIHLFAYVLKTDYLECPHCQELTVEKNSTIRQASTLQTAGEKVVVEACYCCDYRQEQKYTIHEFQRNRETYEISTYDTSNSSDYSSSSSSDYSSSSSSSDYGGGSSGGSGAGDSW